MKVETRLQIKPIQKKPDKIWINRCPIKLKLWIRGPKNQQKMIQKKNKENPQEPWCLKSHSRNNESHDNAEIAFIAPRRLAGNKRIKRMCMDMWSFKKKQTVKKVNEKIQEENFNLPENITIYSSRQIIDRNFLIKSYVDTRDLESMMCTNKWTRYNIKVTTKFI